MSPDQSLDEAFRSRSLSPLLEAFGQEDFVAATRALATISKVVSHYPEMTRLAARVKRAKDLVLKIRKQPPSFLEKLLSGDKTAQRLRRFSAGVETLRDILIRVADDISSIVEMDDDTPQDVPLVRALGKTGKLRDVQEILRNDLEDMQLDMGTFEEYISKELEGEILRLSMTDLVQLGADLAQGHSVRKSGQGTTEVPPTAAHSPEEQGSSPALSSAPTGSAPQGKEPPFKKVTPEETVAQYGDRYNPPGGRETGERATVTADRAAAEMADEISDHVGDKGHFTGDAIRHILRSKLKELGLAESHLRHLSTESLIALYEIGGGDRRELLVEVRRVPVTAAANHDSTLERWRRLAGIGAT